MKITKRQLRRIIKESKGWFLLGLDGTLAKSQKTRTPIWWSNEAGAQQAYDNGYGGEGAVPVEILLAPDMYAYNGSDADPADLESVRQRWAPGTLNKVPSELGESKMKITKRQLRRIIREAFATGVGGVSGDIKVGDRVFYRDQRSEGEYGSDKAVLTVTRLYHGGTMAEVLHDNGYTYKGYVVADMTKEI